MVDDDDDDDIEYRHHQNVCKLSTKLQCCFTNNHGLLCRLHHTADQYYMCTFNTLYGHLYLVKFLSEFIHSIRSQTHYKALNNISSNKIQNMRASRVQYPFKYKFILIGLSLAITLVYVLRASVSSSSSPSSSPIWSRTTQRGGGDCSSVCTKLPPSLDHALLHYSTSTITPQQTLKEISITAKVLQNKSPCNFLIFGLGHDSLMWTALNYGGRTVFLEEDKAWIKLIKTKFPMLESHHVTYDSKVNQANTLMEIGKGPECTEIGEVRHSMCQLALRGLPKEVYETKWDLIMVDAPTGYYEEAPGRMSAIYTAGMLARNRKGGGKTEVFVHDVNREVEDKFSKAFLCQGYMRKQEGRLRHFTIPSYRDGSSTKRPFCPSL